MIAPLLNILAARDDDSGAGKIIFGIIFLIIWGISALVSWFNKQQQEARRREQQMREQFQTTMPPPLPLPLPPQQRVPPRVAQRIPQQITNPRQPAKRPRPVRKQAAMQPVQIVEEPTPVASIAPKPMPAPARPQPASANAIAISRWLSPQTLRSQFILTELLRPPIAMRDDESVL